MSRTANCGKYPPMPKISATIITLNEEHNLPRALASLTWAAEIIVVDSGSTDRTREIAAQHGARVIEHPWAGWSEQKNFAAAQARHDWIFSLDADEAVSPDLEKALRDWQSREPEASGYRFARRANYMGRWINHSGWYPDPKLRLYRRDKGRWAGAIHESVVVDGRVGDLAGEIHHYTHTSLSAHLRQLDDFTTVAARDLYDRGLRASWFRLLVVPPATFLKSYFLQQGFRDGLHGFLIATMAGLNVFVKEAKLWTLTHGGALGDPGRNT